MTASHNAALAFDSIAQDYDRDFTLSTVGSLMRQAVWRRIQPAAIPGSRFLELNCGTGEDALWLARRAVRVIATDISPKMVHIAQAKLLDAGFAEMVTVRQLGILDLGQVSEKHFDGVLSNFGGLNCIEHLQAVALELRQLVRPGGKVFLCIMGPVCLWEWMWFLAQGRPAKAFRRLRRGGVDWSGIRIRYPQIGTVEKAFRPDFRLLHATAIGALLPPPYTEAWAKRHPRLLALLNTWERRLEERAPLAWLADHYLLEFERK
ncbi:MAG TPA: methyltransferase domain-containing protein [Candidatus Angelobacter sp.]|nr:methyltransferase domain-containing protein [Candidatus Angelobacter sp.]